MYETLNEDKKLGMQYRKSKRNERKAKYGNIYVNHIFIEKVKIGKKKFWEQNLDNIFDFFPAINKRSGEEVTYPRRSDIREQQSDKYKRLN
jgi:hypothetical protein